MSEKIYNWDYHTQSGAEIGGQIYDGVGGVNLEGSVETIARLIDEHCSAVGIKVIDKDGDERVIARLIEAYLE